MWSIMKDEGSSVSKKEKAVAAVGRSTRKPRKGQGVEGLYRGWRVGMWGLVGVWGASFIGGMQSGAEGVTEGIPVHGKKF
jgi:mitochondrial fusion and transport protein UGO1